MRPADAIVPETGPFSANSQGTGCFCGSCWPQKMPVPDPGSGALETRPGTGCFSGQQPPEYQPVPFAELLLVVVHSPLTSVWRLFRGQAAFPANNRRKTSQSPSHCFFLLLFTHHSPLTTVWSSLL